MLNPRAQGVTAARRAWFHTHVARDDLFVPEGVEQARLAVAAIARRSYDVLCTGGGDGTFLLAAEALIAAGIAPMPAVLPLRLGTGNAVHDVCGSSPPTPRGLAHDLARAADPDQPASPLRLLDVDGRLAQFAGVGLDADWAADYADMIKRHVGTGPLLPLMRGAPGYALTAIALTLPRLVRRPFITARVIACGAAARLDDAGRPAEHFADGATLHDGPVTMVSASTVRSYTAGQRYFRHVDQIGDAFELKIAFASAYQVVRHARRLLAGEPDPSRVLDLAVTAVRVELSAATRYHIGGDVLPATHAFTVRLSRHTVPVLRSHPVG